MYPPPVPQLKWDTVSDGSLYPPYSLVHFQGLFNVGTVPSIPPYSRFRYQVVLFLDGVRDVSKLVAYLLRI